MSDLNVDFENFSVEPTRAQKIRECIESIKTKDWVAQLGLLVTELGYEETPEESTSKSPHLPGVMSVSKIYNASPEICGCELKLIKNDNDFKMSIGQISVLEVQFLPKAQEYAVFYLSEEKFPELATALEKLEPEIKRARHAKAERQNAFKARFQG